MQGSDIQSRRALLSTGAAAAAGMAVLGPALAGPDGAPPGNLAGLKPLYSRTLARLQQSAAAQASLSPLPSADVRALRRLTFGYRPEDLTAFRALHPDFDTRLQLWVDAQLAGYVPAYPPVNDPPLEAVVNDPASNWSTLDESLADAWQTRVVAEPPWPVYQYPAYETQLFNLHRAIHSQWQLAELLADFWHNHFSVEGVRFGIAPVFAHYDRDVIRAHMLGNFRQMMEAVTRSTAMMYYLDNVSNSRWGPNENFARELQELHTLGAVHSWGFTPEQDIPEADPLPGSATALPAGLKAGYSEADVVQVTLCLTGWTISNAWTDGQDTGEFLWHEPYHEPGPKRVLGIDITGSGMAQAQEVMDLLALHPNTARYVCTKLCRRLVSDDPPAALIEAAATVFNDQWQAPDQLAQVVRAIILSPEFKDAAHWGAKTRKPFEIIAGTARSCGGFDEHLVRPDFVDWVEDVRLGRNYHFSRDLHWLLQTTGGQQFTWVTPDGFPDVKAAWLGSTPLVMSWRALNRMFMSWSPSNPQDDPGSWNWAEYFPIDAVARTKTALAPGERTANRIVDHWVNRMLGYDATQPGEPQLDGELRGKLVDFMRQDAAADAVLDLDQGGWDNAAWNAYVPQRLQTLVASIAMLPDSLLR